jgi:hypothetical protein
MYKKGAGRFGGSASWQRRYVRIDVQHDLMTYCVGSSKDNHKIKGTIQFQQVSNVRLLDQQFNIPSTSKSATVMELTTKSRKYYLAAEDDDTTHRWLAMFMELSKNVIGCTPSSTSSSTGNNSNDNGNDINLDQVNLDLDDIDGTRISMNGTVTGYLLKRPGRGGSWQRRFFKLVEGTSIVTYHASAEDNKIKGEIDLSTCLSVRLSKANSEVSTGLVFELETPKRWWGLAAATDLDMRWYRLIRDYVEGLRSKELASHMPVETFGGVFKGKLYKRGAINSNWQQRFFVLENGSLEWRKSEKIGVSKAGSLEVRSIKAINKEKSGLENKRSKTENGEPLFVFSLKTSASRKYLLGSPNQSALQAWIRSIRLEMTKEQKRK